MYYCFSSTKLTLQKLAVVKTVYLYYFIQYIAEYIATSADQISYLLYFSCTNYYCQNIYCC